MNLIPKVNGRVVTHKGKLTVYEPISFHGKLYEAAWAMRFGLMEATDGLLYFSEDPTIAQEGYKLTVSVEGIELSASDKAGQFYGLITLQQLLKEGRSGLLELNSKIPYMEIEDAPRYSHRGFMLDESRHFIGVIEVERLLEQMALLKLNVFHWHLSDDQGFRIENSKSYTQEEIREVAAFAAERCITVISESDPSDHTSSVVASYPDLSCTEQMPTVENLQKKIFPRLIAVAENAWCQDRTDYEDFLRRLKAYQTTLDELSIAYTPVEQISASLEKAIRQEIERQ